MTTPNLSLAHLEHLLALTKKKLAATLDLESIEKKIAAVFGGHQPAAKAPKPGRKPSRRKIPRGALKDRILTILEEAGPDGTSVGDIAEKLGAKKSSVNQWIYTAGKKAGVKKVSRGRFVFTGKNADASPAEPSPAPTRRGRPPGGKKAVTVKSSKKIERGTLKPSILAALSSAGANGLSVAEVAEKIGAKKNTVNVWFYTTGKKVKEIKKVGRGRFVLRG